MSSIEENTGWWVITPWAMDRPEDMTITQARRAVETLLNDGIAPNHIKTFHRGYETRWFSARARGKQAVTLRNVERKIEYKFPVAGTVIGRFTNTKPNTQELKPSEKGDEEMRSRGTNKTLFEFDLDIDGKMTHVFGYKLTTNSAGLWVMELADTGKVVTVEAGKAVKVMPYTIGVRFYRTGCQPSEYYHYKAKPTDGLKVGDLIFGCGHYEGIARVAALDTKSEKATKWIDGFALPAGVMKELKPVEEEDE